MSWDGYDVFRRRLSFSIKRPKRPETFLIQTSHEGKTESLLCFRFYLYLFIYSLHDPPAFMVPSMHVSLHSRSPHNHTSTLMLHCCAVLVKFTCQSSPEVYLTLNFDKIQSPGSPSGCMRTLKTPRLSLEVLIVFFFISSLPQHLIILAPDLIIMI